MKRRLFNQTQVHKCKGVAAAEFAVVLPVIILLTFGTIELCTAMFLKESATIAAYEGARIAAQKGATDAHVRAHIDNVLSDRSVGRNGKTISQIVDISPSTNTAAQMQSIRVRVTLPLTGNTILPIGHVLNRFGAHDVRGEVHMLKEFQNE